MPLTPSQSRMHHRLPAQSADDTDFPVGKPVPVVLIHPDELTRLGIHHSWATAPGLSILAITGSLDEAAQHLGSDPSVVAVLSLPPNDFASQLLQHAMNDYPFVRWIVLPESSSAELRDRAVRAGVMGYLLPDYRLSRLISTIMWVSIGRKVIDRPKPELNQRRPAASSPQKSPSAPSLDSTEDLSASNTQSTADSAAVRLELATRLMQQAQLLASEQPTAPPVEQTDSNRHVDNAHD